MKTVVRGQVFGFLISITGFSLAAFCAYIGQPWPASVLGAGGLTPLVALFVNRKIKVKS